MKKISIFILIIFSALGVLSQNTSMQMQKYAVKASSYPRKFNTKLDYEVQIFNTIVIKNIRIKGSNKNYNFMFDTGCTESYISKKIVEDINFTPVFKDSIDDGYTRKLVDFGFIDLDIKGVQFNNILVSDSYKPLAPHCDIDGIIGTNVIKLAVWNINLINNEVILTNNIKNIPNYKTYYKQKIDKFNIKSNCITIGANIPSDITFNIISGSFFLDLGDNSFVSLCIDTTKAYNKRDLRKWKEANILTHSKGVAIQTAHNFIINQNEGYNQIKADRFNFSDFRKYPPENTNKYLPNPIVYYDFADDMSVIGAGILDYYSIILDLKKFRFYSKLLKTNNNNANKSFGFNIIILNNIARVATVWKNTFVDKKGIKAGDKVIKLNNLNLEQITQPICKIYHQIEQILKNTDTVEVTYINEDNKQHTLKVQKENLFK